MTNISKESIAGLTTKTWRLLSLKVSKFDEISNNIQTLTINDFNNAEFLSAWGGYAPLRLIFHHNHVFEAMYTIGDGSVLARGSWQLSPEHIVLQQNTGDEILLTNSELDGNTLRTGYDYHSSDYGIAQMVFIQD